MTHAPASDLKHALLRLRALPSLTTPRAPWHVHMLAHLDVARGYADAAALASAEAHLECALDLSRGVPGLDARVDLLCELAELAARGATADEQRAAGSGAAARRRARGHAAQAAQLAAGVSDPTWEITVLLRISDVLGRLGHLDDAADLHCRAMGLVARTRCPAPGRH